MPFTFILYNQGYSILHKINIRDVILNYTLYGDHTKQYFLHREEDGCGCSMCHAFYVCQILQRYNTIYSFFRYSILIYSTYIVSSQCIIGAISISNAIRVTYILFDATTEHVDNFINMYI